MTPYSLTLRTGETVAVADIETAGLLALSGAKAYAAEQIAQIAPIWKQANALRGAYPPEDVAAMWSAIDAIRLDEDTFTAAVQAILDDAELTDAGKLAALDALS